MNMSKFEVNRPEESASEVAAGHGQKVVGGEGGCDEGRHGAGKGTGSLGLSCFTATTVYSDIVTIENAISVKITNWSLYPEFTKIMSLLFVENCKNWIGDKT